MKLIAFDWQGKPRMAVEIAHRDYTPEIAARMQNWVDVRYPAPSSSGLKVVR